MRPKKWLNLKKRSSFGPLSVLWFLAALPIWFLILLMFLMLSTLKRLLSLLLRRPERQVKNVSFIRAPHIPEPLSDMERDQLLDVGSDAWEIAAMRRYRSYLETCLDYSYSEYDDPLA